MKRRYGKECRGRILEQAEAEERICGHGWIDVRGEMTHELPMLAQAQSTHRERRGATRRCVATGQERVDERRLVPPRVLDAEKPGS